MTRIARSFLAVLFALLAAAPAAFAQAPRSYSQAELDQMLAPVALYPDALLWQVLMAATYPLDVVEAARWTRVRPGLQGDDAVRAAQFEDWDRSVKSLVAFPEILQRMDENIGWTRSLGDAFLAQEPQVMDTVQQLRWRAQAAGNLQSSGQIRVEQQGPTIVLQPASPQIIYVPYYDPLVVYGPWWWPAYRPVAWAPWPGYARHHQPGISGGIWWGRPVALSANFFFASPDWRERRVHVVNSHYERPAEVRQRFSIAQDARHVAPRVERLPAPAQVQPAVRVQAQPVADRRLEWARTQIERQEIRHGQPQLRQEPRVERQTAPAQAQPAATVQVQPIADRREDRVHTRIDRHESRPPQPQLRQEQRVERQVAAVQAQPAVRVQAQPIAHRQEERASAHIERHESRPGQPQLRQEQHVERVRKGGERS